VGDRDTVDTKLKKIRGHKSNVKVNNSGCKPVLPKSLPKKDNN